MTSEYNDEEVIRVTTKNLVSDAPVQPASLDVDGQVSLEERRFAYETLRGLFVSRASSSDELDDEAWCKQIDDPEQE